ncbi:hypothetical protein [Streptacidiphilus fuscans]|uniref:Uncharacterized protein n=1 Tax=Streptacidiphilus fuscans TaxID=2789292 RepID=A0A931FEU6_9ACTN|nr:hypothetical protein [Streptacidiphilus fuscans]MBF9070953.1 hypothetical protein [Streptacidiphilus fuscans]
MILQNRSVPTLALAGTATLAAAAALLALPVSRLSAVAVTGDPARATLVRLTDSQVDALGLTAYTGAYGTAVSAAEGQDDPGDFSDPDGMLGRISVATQVARTAASSSKHSAQAQLTALDVYYRSKNLIRVVASVGSFDSYAECVPPPVGPWALAYNRSNSARISVLGHHVGVGTTQVPITGADLGRTDIGPSTLTVTVTPHQDPNSGSAVRQYTAEAWLDITVSGVLNDTAGAQVYDGPISAVRLGEVHADCQVQSPTPTPTSSASFFSLSPSPTGENEPTPPPPPPTPTVTETETGTTERPTHSPHPSPSPDPSTSDRTDEPSWTSEPSWTGEPGPSPTREGGDDLADTGASRSPLAAAMLGLVAVGAGVGAVVTARRRRPRRRH